MIHIEKIEGKPIYKFWIEDNKVDAESMKAFHEVIRQKVEAEEKVRLLGVIRSVPGFTDMRALRQTLTMKLDAIRGVERYAILTDLDWVEGMLPFVDFFTPDMPVRSFDEDEEQEAIAWLEQDEATRTKDRIQIEHVPDTDVYAFTIDGKVDEQGLVQMHKLIKEKAQEKEKIRLLGILKDFDGFEHVRSLLKGFQLDLAAIGNVQRYAVLTDEKWVERMVQIGDWLPLGTDMRAFRHEERTEAIDWLEA